MTGSGKTIHHYANVICGGLAAANDELLRPKPAARLYGEMKEFFRKRGGYFVSYYGYYQPEAYVPEVRIRLSKRQLVNEHIGANAVVGNESVLERRAMSWWWLPCPRFAVTRRPDLYRESIHPHLTVEC